MSMPAQPPGLGCRGQGRWQRSGEDGGPSVIVDSSVAVVFVVPEFHDEKGWGTCDNVDGDQIETWCVQFYRRYSIPSYFLRFLYSISLTFVASTYLFAFVNGSSFPLLLEPFKPSPLCSYTNKSLMNEYLNSHMLFSSSRKVFRRAWLAESFLSTNVNGKQILYLRKPYGKQAMHYTCREESTNLDIYPQHYRDMSVLSLWHCCRPKIKIFGPERCLVFDLEACAACTEDSKLEKEMNQPEIRIQKTLTKRHALRTVMNDNHDRLISRFPPEIASNFIQYSPPSAFFDEDVRPSLSELGPRCGVPKMVTIGLGNAAAFVLAPRWILFPWAM